MTGGTADRAASQSGLVGAGLGGVGRSGADAVARGVGGAKDGDVVTGSPAVSEVVAGRSGPDDVVTVSPAGDPSAGTADEERVRTGVGAAGGAESSPGSPSVPERRGP
ncbi:hypothetical protein AB0G80_37380, partial [Streptomyces asoensis]